MFTNQYFSIPVLLFSSTLLLSGCQLVATPESKNSNISYGEYYLALQQLNELELVEEVEKLQSKIAIIPNQLSINDYDSQIKLLLLYSLPESPIYNSFSAKALLNQMTNEGNSAAFANITPNEQALISLLRDQLNQRLLMHNRLLVKQQEQQKTALKKQQLLVEQIALLQQTIAQLKEIDQTIDKREQ
jgi:hypothetical protein